MENSTKLTQEEKAAAVIISLGADKASKIYKHLSESDIEKLTIEVAKLDILRQSRWKRSWMNFTRSA